MALDAAYALIFGGCCSNVFALEAIVKHEPDSGLLITTTQFLLVALFVLPSQLETGSSFRGSTNQYTTNGSATDKASGGRSTGSDNAKRSSRLRLRSPSLPPSRIAVMSFTFFAVNILNNWAFAFQISVPLHIILRSFGSVTTLFVGWLHGKTYSPVQVFSVIVLTIGVVVSAWADAEAKGKDTSLSAGDKGKSFAAGVGLLFVAQIVSAWMGVYTESTYQKYGRHWKEMLFWSHVGGLVFSVGLAPTLWRQFVSLWRLRDSELSSLIPAPIVDTLRRFTDRSIGRLLAKVSPPQGINLLLLNALTQVACISGVNRLSAQTTAVTVTVVLNIRKLVSFLLSCVIFGNQMSGMMMLGAGIVFGAGAVYGWDGSRKKGVVAKGREQKKEL